jgi:hypothetical protein
MVPDKSTWCSERQWAAAAHADHELGNVMKWLTIPSRPTLYARPLKDLLDQRLGVGHESRDLGPAQKADGGYAVSPERAYSRRSWKKS